MRRFKNFLAKASIALLAVVVTLLALEGILRLMHFNYTPLRIEVINKWSEWRYYHAFEDKQFVYDPFLIWRPRTDGIFNDQGYRGPVVPAFSGRIIVILEPYLEYSLDDMLLKDGWYREMVDETNKLRDGLGAVAKQQGLYYIDDKQMRQSGSILSRFGLYIDDAHLSPLGNRLSAERIHAALQSLGIQGEPARKTSRPTT